MQANFNKKYNAEMSKTAYVTANPFTRNYAKSEDFATLDEVWKYGWDDNLGVVPPGKVTDRAIDVSRSKAPDRLLVHYMQPHFPSLQQPDLGSKIDPVDNIWINNIWDRLSRGKIDEDVVWNEYRQNLHQVLKCVEKLLRNHDASKVIITADHGNGFGERGIYGHPSDRAHRVLRKVPYCVTSATDEGNYTPEQSYSDSTEAGVRDRLSALGYMDNL